MSDTQREEIAKLEALYAAHPEGRVFTHLAEAYRRAGELPRARDILSDGLRRHPDYSSAHVVLGRVLSDEGDTAAAAAAFRRVLELDRHNLVALRALGDISERQGQTSAALGYYRDLQALDPSHEGLRSAIRRLEAESGTPDAVPVAAAEPEVLADAPFEEAGGDEEEAETTGAGAGWLRDVADVDADEEEAAVDAADLPRLAGLETFGGLETGDEPADLDGFDTTLPGLDVSAPFEQPEEEEEEAAPFEALAGFEWTESEGETASEPPSEAEVADLGAWSFRDDAEDADGEEESPPVAPGEAPGPESMEEAPLTVESLQAGEETQAGQESGPELETDRTSERDAAEAGFAAAEIDGEPDEGFREADFAEAEQADAELSDAESRDPEWAEAEWWAAASRSHHPEGAEAEVWSTASRSDDPEGAEADEDLARLEAGPAAADDEEARGEPEPAQGSFVSEADEGDAAAWPSAEGGEPARLEERGEEDAVFQVSRYAASFLRPTEEQDVGVVTATMADLYARQGFYDRAIQVYRQLLADVPDDARLRERLAEVEAMRVAASETYAGESERGADEDTETDEAPWLAGAGGVAGAEDTPYAWADAAGSESGGGTTVGEYFAGLLSWRPAESVPVEGSAASAPVMEEGEDVLDLAEAVEDPSDEVELEAGAMEAAIEEWFGGEGGGEEGRPEGEARGPEGEGDADLEMFRSWLQSLKK